MIYLKLSTLLFGLIFLACGSDAPQNETKNKADIPTQTAPSPGVPLSPEVVPLKVPERVASGAVTESGGGWNEAVRRITYRTSADGTMQPAMFYAPNANDPRPLLVGLHSWSSGYTQEESAIYAEWAIANGWVFIHPHFRGNNESPETTGSELVVKDVLSAVEYAKQNANVEVGRIYAVGWSGGGHLGLLMAGRAPEIWAGISAWVPISDLAAWYGQSRELGTKYVGEIAASCGGNPLTDEKAAAECRRRSPLTYLEKARGVPIDIHHGIHDGHGSEPVPVSQSLHAFNALAAPEDRFTEEEIAYFNSQQRVPPHLESGRNYSSPGDEKVLFRRQSGNVRVTIFDGGHEKDTETALRWLAQQEKR